MRGCPTGTEEDPVQGQVRHRWRGLRVRGELIRRPKITSKERYFITNKYVVEFLLCLGFSYMEFVLCTPANEYWRYHCLVPSLHTLEHGREELENEAREACWVLANG